MGIPKQAYDRVCQFCGQTVAERMLLTSHELYCAKAQLTQCQERLAVAERLFTELERLTELMSGPGMSWDRNDLSKLHTWIEVFLTYAPSDWVAVWRDDLEKAVDFMEHTAGSYWSEVKERLKTALEEKP